MTTMNRCREPVRAGLEPAQRCPRRHVSATRVLVPRQSTVKVPVLVAVPPGVVTAILPVFAPVGAVAVIFV